MKMKSTLKDRMSSPMFDLPKTEQKPKPKTKTKTPPKAQPKPNSK